MEWSIDVVGWCGALIVLLAYTLVSIRRVEGDSVLFQVLNISGAALLLANTLSGLEDTHCIDGREIYELPPHK